VRLKSSKKTFTFSLRESGAIEQMPILSFYTDRRNIKLTNGMMMKLLLGQAEIMIANTMW
jgi:hypothetical protein